MNPNVKKNPFIYFVLKKLETNKMLSKYLLTFFLLPISASTSIGAAFFYFSLSRAMTTQNLYCYRKEICWFFFPITHLDMLEISFYVRNKFLWKPEVNEDWLSRGA